MLFQCNGSKLARPAASWVLREAKQVAPTMRSGRPKGKQVALRSARVPLGVTRSPDR